MTIGKDSVVVITGAASGIGRALALRLSKEQIAGIAISDVDDAGLAETASLIKGTRASTHGVDVSKLDDITRLAEEVISAHGRATHLVNNAGVGILGTFEQLSLDDFEWLMGINYWGVVYACKVFMPILREQRHAHIVNVSSVFGLIAPPEQSAYCSSKFAVRGFTESLRNEMLGSNIAVSCVHPGGIKTNIVRNSRVGTGAPTEWKAQGTKFFDKVARTTPEAAAEAIVKGIKAGEPRILIGADAKAISLLSRLFPRKHLKMLERLSGHKMSLRKE